MELLPSEWDGKILVTFPEEMECGRTLCMDVLERPSHLMCLEHRGSWKKMPKLSELLLTEELFFFP